MFNRCAGAGHLRDDILYYCKEFEKFTDGDDEERAYLMDMGIKALRYSSDSTEIFLLSSYIFALPFDSCKSYVQKGFVDVGNYLYIGWGLTNGNVFLSQSIALLELMQLLNYF